MSHLTLVVHVKDQARPNLECRSAQIESVLTVVGNKPFFQDENHDSSER